MEKYALGLLLLYVSFVKRLALGSIEDRKPYPTSNIACHAGSCGQYSYTEIRTMFRGLLLTLKEIRELERGRAVATDSTSTPTVDTYSDDNSLCCSSRIHHIANLTLINMSGQERSVIHLMDNEPPVYQYIPHAYCVKKGECRGKCVIEPKLMFLLVMDDNLQYTFDVFEVPGYCNCKNIT